MHSISMLGKHLQYKYQLPKGNQKGKEVDLFPIHENIDEICCFTGEKITRGILKSDVIKDVFTDHQYIKHESNYISLDAVFCMQRVIPNKTDGLTSLRNYHFICTEKELNLLKREQLEETLFNLKNEPFVFVITFGFKKHTTFKSKINQSNQNFIITTDKADIKVSMNDVNKIYPVMKKWYTVVKGKENTSAQPTYFSKDDILHGCSNYKKIEDYGDHYFNENEIIKPFRNSLFLELLAYILNKSISE